MKKQSKTMATGINTAKVICVSIIICIAVSINVSAGEKATREECISKCKEAAELVKKIGMDAAIAKIMEKDSPFMWKDTYVFCINMKTGVMLAHPAVPNMVGKNVKGFKDKNGVLLTIGYMKIASTKGKGWFDYVWPKPGEKKPSPKSCYVYRVPGEDVMMLAGIYTD
ncbi:cache domain-containing protein [Desulfobacterales bacterium HSG16]|nr:cache domain-containing protein [Desulfobacterales bacterium HSG16]